MAAFITLHSLPAEHFVCFERVFRGVVPTYMMFGDMAKKALNITPLYLDLDLLDKSDMDAFAEQIAKTCECANIIFISIGHASSGYIVKAIHNSYKDTKRIILYYDNPEAFVPGGYSEVAYAAIEFGKPKEIKIANKNLASLDIGIFKGLERVKKIGLGFYPMKQVEDLKKARSRKEMRRERVFLYLGGSETNTEYMEKAFPAFLQMLKQMSFEKEPTTLYFRAHPRSSGIDFRAVEALSKPGLTVLKAPQDLLESLSLADYALYYQTSLSPLIVLGGIQAIQVGHEVYHEILVDKGIIPFATTVEELDVVLKRSFSCYSEDAVYDAVGFDPKWEENLLDLL